MINSDDAKRNKWMKTADEIDRDEWESGRTDGRNLTVEVDLKSVVGKFAEWKLNARLALCELYLKINITQNFVTHA